MSGAPRAPTGGPTRHATAPLLREIFEKHPLLVDELAELSEFVVHRDESTGVEDCRLLYLLVRLFKPKTLLEIGTFVGSTCNALALACEKNGNGARIITVDRDSSAYEVPARFDSIVAKREGDANDVLRALDSPIDFAFCDANLDRRSFEALSRRISERLVFVTHDFTWISHRHLDKGVVAAVLAMEHLRGDPCWFLPPPKLEEEKWKPVEVHGVGISSCCAFALPRALVDEVGLSPKALEPEPREPLSRFRASGVFTFRLHGLAVRFVRHEDGRFQFWGYQTPSWWLRLRWRLSKRIRRRRQGA